MKKRFRLHIIFVLLITCFSLFAIKLIIDGITSNPAKHVETVDVPSIVPVLSDVEEDIIVIDEEDIVIAADEEDIVTAVDEEDFETSEIQFEFSELPTLILREVKRQENNYPGIEIAVGIYSLDGTKGYEYNADKIISGGCTVKAAYALYVLQECEEQNIDIFSKTLTYKQKYRNNGSGIIKDSPYGSKYTISYLLEVLLDVSDNTAYNILVSRFPLSDFQKFLNEIDGQNLNGKQYGAASVLQRKNEWIAIYDYINSDSLYAENLRQYLTNTKYCYLVAFMKGDHDYMHKSGWSSFTTSNKYSCACDCAIIDENYLLIVLTQDYETGESHARAVKKIGLSVEKYANSLGGSIF